MTTSVPNGAIANSNSNKMTSSGVDIFKKAVEHILNDWPSLDLAIENGMGGSQATDKRQWMIKYVIDSMLNAKDIDALGMLEDILDQEFDTIIEDGSLEYNSRWIEKFYKDCLAGKEQDVLNSITQASIKKMSLDRVDRPAPICLKDGHESSSESEDEEEE